MTPKNSDEAIRMGLEDIGNKFGIRFSRIENGEAEASAPLMSKDRNFYNVPYGAVMFNLADNTAGMAYLSTGGNGVTVSGNVNYLRGADPTASKLHSRARVIKRGRKLCFISAEVEDDLGNLLSTYSFVFSDI
jgi:uncharacterized protein (TIGR00369 family)